MLCCVLSQLLPLTVRQSAVEMLSQPGLSGMLPLTVRQSAVEMLSQPGVSGMLPLTVRQSAVEMLSQPGLSGMLPVSVSLKFSLHSLQTFCCTEEILHKCSLGRG